MPTNAINDTGVKYLYDKLHGEIEPVAEAVSDSEVIIEGNPLSFNALSSQNAKSTILSLEPIQDLHGFDKPWVGGAGKNKLPLTGTTQTIDGETFTVNSNGTITTSNTPSAVVRYDICAEGFTLKAGTYLLKGMPVNSESGTRIALRPNISEYSTEIATCTSPSGSTFTLNADTTVYAVFISTPTGNHNITISPMIISSSEPDTSFAPWKNECPISGRSEIGILGCGKNLFDATNVVNNKRVSGTAGNLWNYNGYCSSAPIEIAPNSVYRKTSGIESYYAFYDKDLRYIGGGAWVDNVTKTSPENAKYLRFDMQMTNKDNVQLEKGNQATPYSPYTESTDLTISLGQTVYGGTLDVENGVLVVDMKYVTITSMTRNSATAYYANVSPVAVADDFTYIKSDRVETSDGEGVGIFSNWMGAIRLNTPIGFDNASDMMAFYGNEINVCYKLATPITINLTPYTINLLKGVNNISTDGDKITLTYRDGSVATLGDLTSAVDNLNSKIDESKILTDTVTGDKYILVVTNGVLSIEQISN